MVKLFLFIACCTAINVLAGVMPDEFTEKIQAAPRLNNLPPPSVGRTPIAPQSNHDGIQIIKPERTTLVELSNHDMNRIHCANGEINDLYYSEEKGITDKIEGSNLFIKYKIRQTNFGTKTHSCLLYTSPSPRD